MGGLETAATAEQELPKRTKQSHYQRRRYEPKSFDLRGKLYRIFGVDLTNVPGISAITAHTILSEIGTDAITATAHKLARIVFHLLSTKEAYNEAVFNKCEEKRLRRAELRLRKHAAQLGFQVIAAANS